MYIKLTKSVIIIMILIFVLTCCQKYNNSNFEHGIKTQPSLNQAQSDASGFKKLDKPVILKFLSVEHQDMPLSSNVLVWQELFKRTNIKIDLIPMSNQDYYEKVITMIASGNEWDLVNLGIKKINEYASKLFCPLDGFINNEGKNLKKLLTPEIRLKLINSDGHLYAFPLLTLEKPDYVWMLRKDYLDKFKLNEPESLEDWEYFWQMVKESDFDHNGKNDTIPFTPRSDDVLKMNIFPVFGLHYSDFYLEDDEFICAWETEKCRRAIEWLQHIYKKGFLDQKYALMNRIIWAEKIAMGDAISTQGPIFRVSAFNSNSSSDIKGFEIAGTKPPKGPGGYRGIKTIDPVNTSYCVAVNKKSENRLAALKFIDYFFSDEGSVLSTWGVEGVTYHLKNGNKVWSKEMLRNRNNYALFAKYGVMLFLFPRRTDPGQTELMKDADSARALEKNKQFYIPIYPEPLLYSNEIITRKNIESVLIPLIYTYFNKFIMGEIEITDKNWDKFQNDLIDAKVEEYVSIQNKGYLRYKQKYGEMLEK